MLRNSTVVSVLFFGVSAYADVLRLKAGGGVQGTLVSANSSEIRFESVSGDLKTYRFADVSGVEFAPLLPPPAPAPTAAPARHGSTLVLPAGTEITVRMIDSIQGSATGVGQRYSCSVDDPIAAGDRVVIPRGANCTVQVVALEGGKDLDLSLYNVSVQGKAYATATEYAVVNAEGTSKKKSGVKRGIGLGAIGAGIGAIAGGGTGAAIGAAVGGGVGAASAVKAKGKKLEVPTETRLSFMLKTPLPLN